MNDYFTWFKITVIIGKVLIEIERVPGRQTPSSVGIFKQITWGTVNFFCNGRWVRHVISIGLSLTIEHIREHLIA